MTNIEQYASQIPLVLRQTYKAFASDNRSAIVIALYNNNKRLSFNQLKHVLDIDQRILTDELRRLISGAVVDHYTEYRNGVKDYSYYILTDYGTNILTATLNVLAKSYERTIKSDIISEKTISADSQQIDTIKSDFINNPYGLNPGWVTA